jgi:hypothetical protein
VPDMLGISPKATTKSRRHGCFKRLTEAARGGRCTPAQPQHRPVLLTLRSSACCRCFAASEALPALSMSAPSSCTQHSNTDATCNQHAVTTCSHNMQSQHAVTT